MSVSMEWPVPRQGKPFLSHTERLFSRAHYGVWSLVAASSLCSDIWNWAKKERNSRPLPVPYPFNTCPGKVHRFAKRKEISFWLRLPPCEQPLFLLSVEKPSNLVFFSNSYFICRLFAGTSDLTCSSFFLSFPGSAYWGRSEIRTFAGIWSYLFFLRKLGPF